MKHRIMKSKKNDLTDKKFNKLSVIGLAPIEKWGKTRYRYWLCRCECGNEAVVSSNRLKMNGTKSCGCLQTETKKKNRGWDGFEDISKVYYEQVKRNAKVRNFTFNLTINQLWNVFLKQNKKCVMTGLPLKFSKYSGKSDGNASLDRIDSNKGYDLNNIQWIHKDVNKMKNNLKEANFLEYCKLICINKKLL